MNEAIRCQNPSCKHPIAIIPGHRRRQYCNDACKQAAHRARMLAAQQKEWARKGDLQERNKLIDEILEDAERLEFPACSTESFTIKPGLNCWLTFCNESSNAWLRLARDTVYLRVQALAGRERLRQLSANVTR